MTFEVKYCKTAYISETINMYGKLPEEIDERGAVTQVDIVLRSITHNGHPCSPDEDEGKRQYQTDFVGNIFL